MRPSDEPLSATDREVESRLRAAAAAASEASFDLSQDDLALKARRFEERRALRRRVGVLAVAALIVVVFLVPLPHVSLFNRLGRAANAPTAMRWTATDLGPAFYNAVACPTATHCIALGPDGWEAWSDDGGRSWQSAVVPSLPKVSFSAVSCPTATRCIAVAAATKALTATGKTPAAVPGVAAVSGDGGRNWRRASVPGSAVELMGGLACPTTELCYATAESTGHVPAGFLLESDDGGLSWQRRLPGTEEGFRDNALSCPAVRECWATGGPYGVLETSNGGESWKAARMPLGAGGYAGVEDIYCLSVLRCIAVGVEPSPGYPVVVVTSNGGASWRFAGYESSAAALLTGATGGLSYVSCATPAWCVAIGQALEGPVIAVSEDAGESWRELATPSPLSGGTLMAATCDSSQGCIVVGSTRNDASLIATSRTKAPWTVRSQGIGASWSSVSCPSQRRCIAVGSGSLGYPSGAEAITSSDGGRSWSQAVLPVGVVSLSGVECTTVSLCLATAEVTSPPELARKGIAWQAAVLRSDDGGVTWSRQRLPRLLLLAAISCPSADTCFAVGAADANGVPGHDAVEKTVDGGAHWADQAVPTPVGANGLYGVSCPSTTRCWAVGPLGVLATTNGGRTWWDRPLAGSLQAISCPSEQTCVAVSSGPYYADSSEPVAVVYLTRNGGRSWTSAPLPAANLSLADVSCANTDDCVAVGGIVLASSDGGHRWSVQTVPEPGASAGYDAVTCTSPSHCVALGGGSISAVALGS